MNGTRWVIIDTETDGLNAPIHIVEISGQLMDGWEPVGEPFRMLLNHDVPIPYAAEMIHGYSREFLRQHGQDPRQVHDAFREYARDYSLVAHNLSYDWNRCFEPEWARLGVQPAGRRGFCSMMLARRLLWDVPSFRLERLKHHFQLTESRSHQARQDVQTVVELFQRVYRARLEAAGIRSFEEMAAFARRTPVAKCLEAVRTAWEPKTVRPLAMVSSVVPPVVPGAQNPAAASGPSRLLKNLEIN